MDDEMKDILQTLSKDYREQRSNTWINIVSPILSILIAVGTIAFYSAKTANTIENTLIIIEEKFRKQDFNNQIIENELNKNDSNIKLIPLD